VCRPLSGDYLEQVPPERRASFRTRSRIWSARATRSPSARQIPSRLREQERRL